LSWFGSRVEVEGEEGDDVGGSGREIEVIMVGKREMKKKRRMGSNGDGGDGFIV
jgi:hypothetical protein